MKKILMFLCVGVLSFSLTACGGSSDTPAPPKPVEVPKEPEISQEEKVRQEILALVDFAYTGHTTENVPMYFLLGNKGEYAALMIVNTDGKKYIKFDGSRGYRRIHDIGQK